jgi:hypothetical protein
MATITALQAIVRWRTGPRAINASTTLKGQEKADALQGFRVALTIFLHHWVRNTDGFIRHLNALPTPSQGEHAALTLEQQALIENQVRLPGTAEDVLKFLEETIGPHPLNKEGVDRMKQRRSLADAARAGQGRSSSLSQAPAATLKTYQWADPCAAAVRLVGDVPSYIDIFELCVQSGCCPMDQAEDGSLHQMVRKSARVLAHFPHSACVLLPCLLSEFERHTAAPTNK